MKRIVILLVSAIFLTLTASVVTAGDSPTAQLQATIDKVLEVLGTDLEDKPGHIAEVIKPRFDFERMAKLTLHKHWDGQSPEDKKEFIRLFSKLLEKTYITKISLYSSPQVQYVRERQQGGKAAVDTNVIVNGTAINVSYLMYQAGGEWKIYDVNVEGVSLVRNYRNQLTGILRTKSFTTLLNTLEQKVS